MTDAHPTFIDAIVERLNGYTFRRPGVWVRTERLGITHMMHVDDNGLLWGWVTLGLSSLYPGSTHVRTWNRHWDGWDYDRFNEYVDAWAYRLAHETGSDRHGYVRDTVHNRIDRAGFNVPLVRPSLNVDDDFHVEAVEGALPPRLENASSRRTGLRC